ncbi:hypothetical protein GE061_006463 [Apolygus lucorum]|uniref:Uncharacterized protein n=1 Tax=Apolygus lucorum TaxID=248454 RepID=A0A6A4JCP3_APOLU|nr:hypothetical protein GE061_006463 [Apolygus lucorum]
MATANQYSYRQKTSDDAMKPVSAHAVPDLFPQREFWFSKGAYEGDSPTLNERDDTGFDDYSENDLENILQVAEKRGCIRRGGNCDYRASDCCVNSACRCNLWGANCRCQRRGIFQKWGE